MRIVLVVIPCILALWIFVPFVAYLYQAKRDGLYERVVERYGRSAVFRALADHAIGLFRILATYPLYRVPGVVKPRIASGNGPVIVFVHGLFHNPTAWLHFEKSLRNKGWFSAVFFRYSSWFSVYPEICADFKIFLHQMLDENPGRKLALVGHSLGGLVIAGAMADPRIAENTARVVTLGTPFQGSALSVLGVPRLARSLKPGGELVRYIEGLDGFDCPKTAIVSLLDNMVVPNSGLIPKNKASWIIKTGPPVSHIGMLYSEEVVRLTDSALR